jgi:hypothetical protein
VALADMLHRPGTRINRFAVHEKPLDKGDVSLLQQVADIMPFRVTVCWCCTLDGGSRTALTMPNPTRATRAQRCAAAGRIEPPFAPCIRQKTPHHPLSRKLEMPCCWFDFLQQ